MVGLSPIFKLGVGLLGRRSSPRCLRPSASTSFPKFCPGLLPFLKALRDNMSQYSSKRTEYSSTVSSGSIVSAVRSSVPAKIVLVTSLQRLSQPPLSPEGTKTLAGGATGATVTDVAATGTEAAGAATAGAGVAGVGEVGATAAGAGGPSRLDRWDSMTKRKWQWERHRQQRR